MEQRAWSREHGAEGMEQRAWGRAHGAERMEVGEGKREKGKRDGMTE
jgi:hypothetical protein